MSNDTPSTVAPPTLTVPAEGMDTQPSAPMSRDDAMAFIVGPPKPVKPLSLAPPNAEVVLAALIKDYDKNNWLLEELSEDHFGLFGMQTELFKAVLAVEKAGLVVGVPTVLARCKETGVLERDEVEKSLRQWIAEYDAGINLHSAVNALQRQLKSNQIRTILTSGRNDLESLDKEPHVIATEIANRLDGLSATTQIPTVSQQELNAQMMVSLTTEPPPAYSTGFAELDKRIGGLTPKRTYVIGARTGQGKSAMLLNILASLGKQEVPTGFISLEMDRITMDKRLSCIAGGIESHRLKYPLDEETNRTLDALNVKMDKWPIYWSDKRGMSLVDLRTKLSQFARVGCKVVFVDYIQRVVVGGKDPKHIQVGQVAKTLADLADKLNIAVLVASQMNREGGKSEVGPELHHLAESTVIEESADVIILLNYKKRDDETQGRNRPVNINVAKNRHGFGGPFTMYFCGRQFKFSDTPFTVPSPYVSQPTNIPPRPIITGELSQDRQAPDCQKTTDPAP